MPTQQQESPGLYSIEELGIKVDKVAGRIYNRFNDKPIIPFFNHSTGESMMVRLPINLGHILGNSRIMRLSRIICFVQNGNPPSSKHFAYHRNLDFMDNRGSNLVWADRQYSSQQAVIGGRILTKMLPHVNTIRTLAANGFKNLDAMAAVWNVKPKTIRNIIKGKTYSYIVKEDNPQALVNASVLDILLGKSEALKNRVAAVKAEHRS
jgi:hypothetical protein